MPSNPQLEANYIHETYVHVYHHNEKIRTVYRSDCPSTNILLFQPV
ncbi:hypothetical protein [Priestia aryabhattai]|nr:hypothetical protein [Priestia aryabhattai]